jgi:hypothetical protein
MSLDDWWEVFETLKIQLMLGAPATAAATTTNKKRTSAPASSSSLSVSTAAVEGARSSGAQSATASSSMSAASSSLTAARGGNSSPTVSASATRSSNTTNNNVARSSSAKAFKRSDRQHRASAVVVPSASELLGSAQAPRTRRLSDPTAGIEPDEDEITARLQKALGIPLSSSVTSVAAVTPPLPTSGGRGCAVERTNRHSFSPRKKDKTSPRHAESASTSPRGSSPDATSANTTLPSGGGSSSSSTQASALASRSPSAARSDTVPRRKRRDPSTLARSSGHAPRVLRTSSNRSVGSASASDGAGGTPRSEHADDDNADDDGHDADNNDVEERSVSPPPSPRRPSTVSSAPELSARAAPLLRTSKGSSVRFRELMQQVRDVCARA